MNGKFALLSFFRVLRPASIPFLELQPVAHEAERRPIIRMAKASLGFFRMPDKDAAAARRRINLAAIGILHIADAGAACGKRQ